MHGPSFVVVGTGLLGGWVLELLARTPVPARIVAVDRDGERGLRKVNCVARGARESTPLRNAPPHSLAAPFAFG